MQLAQPQALKKCAKCGNKLVGSWTESNGKSYHPTCFQCDKCKEPLGTLGRFVRVGDKTYCRPCRNSMIGNATYSKKLPPSNNQSSNFAKPRPMVGSKEYHNNTNQHIPKQQQSNNVYQRNSRTNTNNSNGSYNRNKQQSFGGIQAANQLGTSGSSHNLNTQQQSNYNPANNINNGSQHNLNAMNQMNNNSQQNLNMNHMNNGSQHNMYNNMNNGSQQNMFHHNNMNNGSQQSLYQQQPQQNNMYNQQQQIQPQQHNNWGNPPMNTMNNFQGSQMNMNPNMYGSQMNMNMNHQPQNQMQAPPSYNNFNPNMMNNYGPSQMNMNQQQQNMYPSQMDMSQQQMVPPPPEQPVMTEEEIADWHDHSTANQPRDFIGYNEVQKKEKTAKEVKGNGGIQLPEDYEDPNPYKPPTDYSNDSNTYKPPQAVDNSKKKKKKFKLFG